MRGRERAERAERRGGAREREGGEGGTDKETVMVVVETEGGEGVDRRIVDHYEQQRENREGRRRRRATTTYLTTYCYIPCRHIAQIERKKRYKPCNGANLVGRGAQSPGTPPSSRQTFESVFHACLFGCAPASEGAWLEKVQSQNLTKSTTISVRLKVHAQVRCRDRKNGGKAAKAPRRASI
eukprot:1368183-Pleurochrysis_carterae.AAC.1